MTSRRMKEIERHSGKPFKDVLIETFAREGSQTAAAKALGVTQSTFSYWLIRYGLKIKSELVEREQA